MNVNLIGFINYGEMRKIISNLILIFCFLIYSSSGIFCKLASMQDFLSLSYIFFFCCVVAILGFYAILWQQIIKRMPVGNAYMFKGTTLVWTMLFCYFIFGETITIRNIIGAIIIIIGVTFYAWTGGKNIGKGSGA